MDLSKLSVIELLETYASILKELKSRGIVHSTNNPVANYSELLVCRALGLHGMTESNKGYDAKDDRGHKYEIKGRRLTSENPSRQLSVLRELGNGHFDYLVGVLFSENFRVDKGCVIPHELVLERAKYRTHTNAHIFHLVDDIWDKKGVRDITENLKKAEREISQ